ncbi:haloacid dehalogenase type II [Burkholderia plantarii]|uniref:haloacid dehalogenase type II n=1 Tax=Burkholderia plantarii TaxID=41899 RepID=UPI00272D2C91|nr:haloacid dehalogenase type II [Burkholderia plantarii]WLE59857.1 haloacid dehalogenase type II [Burkholderia plantarii]
MSPATTPDSATAHATPAAFPKAILFDAYGTLFDVHSVHAAAEQLFAGHGEALSRLWRRKQIEYTQLRTLADPAGTHYLPFWDITRDALRHACRALGLPLAAAAEKRLMDEYACLSTHPDTVPALRRLREMPGAPRLAILSNGDARMLDIAVKSAGMAGLFEQVLSVETVRAYKPAAAAYRLGTEAFDASASELVFVSSNGWDAAGAGWYGYTVFWLNRTGAPAEELGIAPAGTGARMDDLLAFMGAAGSPVSRSGAPD